MSPLTVDVLAGEQRIISSAESEPRVWTALEKLSSQHDTPRLEREGDQLVMKWRGIHRRLRWYGDVRLRVESNAGDTRVLMSVIPTRIPTLLAYLPLSIVGGAGLLTFVGALVGMMLNSELVAGFFIAMGVSLVLVLATIGLAIAMQAIHRWTLHRVTDVAEAMVREALGGQAPASI